jgi:phosphatidate phosphatase PAH1
MGNDYLHHGYHDLVTGIYEHGYMVVWLTMRSLPMYEFSKKYIRDNIKVEGPLLMEPE